MGVEGRCVHPQPGGSRRAGDARCRRSSPGFILVAFSLALLLILGAVGLSFDIGRMYVTRSEGQSFVDSAAIAAALKLNGTVAELQAGRDAAAATVKGWQFGTTAFPFNSSTDVTFAKAVTGSFLANPSPADGYSCARVTTRVSLPIFLLPALVGATSSSIAAAGVVRDEIRNGPNRGGWVYNRRWPGNQKGNPG